MLRRLSRRSFDSDFGLPLFLVDNLVVAFSTLDTDRSGYLERSELEGAVTSMFPTLEAEAIAQITDSIVKGADENNDGKIDLDEFMRFVERRRQELEKTVDAVRFTAEGCGNELSKAIVNGLSTQCLSSMFHTFVGGGESTLQPGALLKMDAQSLRSMVLEIFPDLPEQCVAEIVAAILDAVRTSADGSNQAPLKVDVLVSALALPYEHIKYQSKKLVPLGQRSASNISMIAELHRVDSIIENPLNHLSDKQIQLLVKNIISAAVKGASQQSFRDAVCVQFALRNCFDAPGVDDELIEDVTNILCLVNRHGSNFGVGELLRALQTMAHSQEQAADASSVQDARLMFYSLTSVSAAVRQQIQDALTPEEIDLLRDTFIRLDFDGDGLVSEADCAQVVEDVLESKFSTFQPYLHALFAIADKNGDARLSLEEFLLSFLEGPGVVPQEIITSCVAPIRLRLSGEELVLIQRAFHAMDKDGDGKLDFEELLNAMQFALKPSFPDINEKQYQDVADVIFSKADRDMDGKLSLSEFCRSLQEEQGVIPIQLVEVFSKQELPTSPPAQMPTVVLIDASNDIPAQAEGNTPPRPPPQPTVHQDTHSPKGSHFAGFEDALGFLSLADIAAVSNVLVKFISAPKEFNPPAATKQFLHDELCTTGLATEAIDRMIDVFLDYGHRNASGDVSVADVIRRFSLGQLHKPKHHSAAASTGAHALSGSIKATSDANPRGSRRSSSSKSASSQLAASGAGEAAPNDAASGGEEEELDGSTSSSAKVYVPSAETTILEKMFARFDTNRDGFLSIDDVSSTMIRLLEERNPTWSKQHLEEHVLKQFVAVDLDEDGRLSFEEFAESFRSGNGLFPEDYVQALSEQVLLDLRSVNLHAILGSLERLEHHHQTNGFATPAQLADNLERIVTPYVEEGNYARVRTMVDYMLLFCPHSEEQGRVLLDGLLRFIKRDLLGDVSSATVQTSAPAQPDSDLATPPAVATDASEATASDQAPAPPPETVPEVVTSVPTNEDTTSRQETADEAPPPPQEVHAPHVPDIEPSPQAPISPSAQEPAVAPAPEADASQQQPAAAETENALLVAAPYEWNVMRRVVSSIAQANAKISDSDLESKFAAAMLELFLDDQAVARDATTRLMRRAREYAGADGIIDMEAFATVSVGTDVPPTVLGFAVEDKESRRAGAVAAINETLPTAERRRALAEALLQVDVERTGEIDFDALATKIHEPLRNLSAVAYHRLVRALRLVGEPTIIGTFSISEFLRPFATVYYVEPTQPLPTGGLLRRLSTIEERLLLATIEGLVFAYSDTGATHETKIAEVAKALGDALVQQGFTETVALHDLRTICHLVGEVVVTGEQSLEQLQKNVKNLVIPWTLMPSRPRCEYALRKLRVEVGEAQYLRKLCRVLLLTDRHRNGVFSHSVLSEALSSELRLLHRDWSANRVGMSVEEWVLAAEVDDKNFLHFGKMMDVMLDLFPFVYPSLVGAVRVHQPLPDPDALQAALHHLAAAGEIPALQLKVFSSDGNGPVTAVLNFFSAVGWQGERGTIDFKSIYPACRFNSEGMTVLLDGLDQEFAQRAIFHVLSVTRQRDLACAFCVLDHKRDNVLDFEELEGVLVHHERAIMKLGGTRSTTGVRSGRLMDMDLLERAKNVFAAVDKMKLGLVALEDFLAGFAQGVLQYDLIESIIEVSSSTPSPSKNRDAHEVEDKSRGHVGQPRKPQDGTPNRSVIPVAAEMTEELEQEFRRYDKKNNGYLSRAEFSEAYLKLEHFGLVPSKADIDKLFASICSSKEKMTFDEFCIIMLRRSRM